MDTGDFRASQLIERDGQIFKLVVEGTIEVIPGPLSKIRAICEEVTATNPDESWPREILAIVEREA